MFEDRIKYVRDVIERARAVFVVSNLATLLCLAALFNTYFSWIRHLPSRPGLSEAKMNALLRAQYSDLMVVSAPVLGIKVFGADLAPVSAGAMFVLSIWLFYAFRREQHSVGKLILEVSSRIPGRRNEEAPKAPRATRSWRERRRERFSDGAGLALEVEKGDLDRARHVLFSLSTAFVFVTTERDRAFGHGEDDGDDDDYRQEAPDLIVWAKKALLWAPCWVIVLCLFTDVATLVFPSVIAAEGAPRLGDQLSSAEWLDFSMRFVLSALVAILVYVVLKDVDYYSRWTQRLYRALYLAVERATASPEVAIENGAGEV